MSSTQAGGNFVATPSVIGQTQGGGAAPPPATGFLNRKPLIIGGVPAYVVQYGFKVL